MRWIGNERYDMKWGALWVVGPLRQAGTNAKSHQAKVPTVYLPLKRM